MSRRRRLDDRALVLIRAAVRAEAERPVPPEVRVLVDALRERFGAGFAGALFYGACRRVPDPASILDLHVLVTDLRRALGTVPAALCRLLPPNVYYLEARHGDATVRCKYAVLSKRQFRWGSSRAAFHSYFWARYAQPLTVVGATDPDWIVDGLVEAVETLARRALPRLEPPADGRAFWEGALRLCYRAELRPEGRDRAAEIVDAYPDYFRTTGDAVLAGLTAGGLTAARLTAGGLTVARRPTAAARLDWGARVALGKLLSLLRLLKGLFTFDGGIDYVAWKLERHTGRPVEIPERARRRPWLYLWPLVWRHWRQGTFR